jgi:hypothetical protein
MNPKFQSPREASVPSLVPSGSTNEGQRVGTSFSTESYPEGLCHQPELAKEIKALMTSLPHEPWFLNRLL